ncbi:MAG: YggU family protein [Candidatus Verstraetearchaeota archaeon]|nr:YggU family protein [Candidatus Verstraetearchaeota archaeon]
MNFIKPHKEGVLLTIHVKPSSPRRGIHLDPQTQQLEVHVKSPPHRGKANQEAIKLLAKHLKIPQTNITIVAGHHQPTKTLLIRGVTISHLEELLASL